MDNLVIVVLALVQGLTEFLPISSSAHLVILPQLLNWPEQGLVFDVALHIGSLVAVLYYFRVEVKSMLKSWLRSLLGGEADQNSLLAWWVIIGTFPAVLAGFFLQGFIEEELRTPWIVAVASIGFGLLLWLADARAQQTRTEFELNLKDVLIIGCFQAVSLLPGTSRSGITITLGLFLGLTRIAAARFSFLLAIPIIVSSGVLQVVRMWTEVHPVEWFDLMSGAVISAISATLCIHFFLRLIERVGMLPFVIYRVLLGVVILVLLG